MLILQVSSFRLLLLFLFFFVFSLFSRLH
jgi:hypothetical protein